MTERPEPWTRSQVGLSVAGAVAGVLLVGLAWIGSSSTDALGDQIGWLNLAVLGLVLAASADLAWLLVGRRAVGRRRLCALPERGPVGPASVMAAVEADWWWLPGTRRGHRPGCLLVAGKPVVPVGREEIAVHGLQRCEVCAGGPEGRP